MLTWAKDLTLNTTGPTVWHLLSCCTGGRCWAANISFYSMKYGNKLHNQYFISNNLVINAKVHYPRASPSLCCTTFHWKPRKSYKEINEIMAAGKGKGNKEAKPSDMEKKFRLQLQDKLDASTTEVKSRFKAIIKLKPHCWHWGITHFLEVTALEYLSTPAQVCQANS